jgi:hypothetical protein
MARKAAKQATQQTPFGQTWSLLEQEARRLWEIEQARARREWERSAELVPEDKLYFRLEPADERSPPPMAEEAKETFRAAFVAVWGRIPRADRDLLLRHWRPRASAARQLHNHPAIRVVEATPWSPAPDRCQGADSRLNFTLAEVLETPGDLPSEIATALARVLLADRRHWELVEEIIEAPMRRWEKRHGKEIGDPEHDAKLDKLEQAHHKVYVREVGLIVRRWGFEPAALPPWRSSAESGE